MNLMNRRHFIGLSALTTLGLATSGSLLQAATQKKVQKPDFSLTGNNVRFFGEAFSKSTRIVFLSDTHLWQSDEREEPTRQYSARMAAAYNQTQHFQTGQPTNPVQAFEATLSHAVEQRADLLVLAGDIFSYPSEAAIEWLHARVKESNIPTFILLAIMIGTMKACLAPLIICARPGPLNASNPFIRVKTR